MTIIEGLNELKAAGITNLVGMAGITDIDIYIEHATQSHENAVKYAAQGVQTWQHSLDHENDHYMIQTADGHYILVSTYGTADGHPFDMATYSDYDTDEEMHAAFDAWKIAQQAEAIADEMTTTRPGELPRAAWILIATAELKAAHAAAMAAFERDYGRA